MKNNLHFSRQPSTIIWKGCLFQQLVRAVDLWQLKFSELQQFTLTHLKCLLTWRVLKTRLALNMLSGFFYKLYYSASVDLL